jgi:hypothetical protein
MRTSAVPAVAIALCVLSAVSNSEASSDPLPAYSGSFADYGIGGVSFRVKSKTVRFEATNVFVVCQDGTHKRLSFAPTSVPFIGRRSFEAAKYSLDPDGTERYYGVGGRLGEGGRVRGFLVYFRNAPHPHERDCSTEGKVRWTARRVD